MSKLQEFIDQLIAIASDEVAGRAKLAALRRGTSGEDRDLARVYPIVLPYARGNLEYQQACIETACLFGLHPTSKTQATEAVSLAQALRRLSDTSKSIESRFQALLQCHREELLDHLRSCIGIAGAHAIPLKWTDILRAMLSWNDNDVELHRDPRRRWAQEFWGFQQTEVATAS